MKKFGIIVCMTCCSMGLLAQNAPGKFSVKPMAGINVSTFAGDNSDFSKSKVGFTGGAEVEYGINNWLGLSLGMLYSEQGGKMEANAMAEQGTGDSKEMVFVTIKGKLKSSYLSLPLLANVYIPAVKGLAVKAGLQLGILLKDKMTTDQQIVTRTFSDVNSYYEVLEGTNTITRTESFFSGSDVLKSIDFGIPVGLSYEFKNITLDARYYFGLTKIDDTKDAEDIKNRHFSVTLGYRFHL